MTVSRRFFLGGSLALTASQSQAAEAGHAAVLYANGSDDDTAGLQALFDGRPVLLAGDRRVVRVLSGEIVLNGSYVVSGPLRATRPGVGLVMNQLRLLRPGADPMLSAARAGDVITPRQFGAAGNGIQDDSRALAAALASVAGSGKALHLESGLRYVAGDLSIPAGAVLVFEPGASLAPLRKGSRLLIDGRIVNEGGGQILQDGWTFARTDILEGFVDVPIEWFGGRSSFLDKNDNSPALRYALAFCKQMRARNVLFGAGGYFFNETVVIDAPIGIRGAGIRSTFLLGRNTGAVSPVIALKGSRELNIVDVRFEHFSIYAEVPGTRVGMLCEWFTSVTMDDVAFVNCETGLDLKYMGYCWTISNGSFIDNRRHLVLGEEAHNTLVWRCQFMNGIHGIHITGSCNAITIGGQTNLERTRFPISWEGKGNRISLLGITDCRFEKCTGPIGRTSGTTVVEGFSFQRNFVENSDGTSEIFLRLPDCDTATISNCYFRRTNKALLDAPVSSKQVTVSDNVLIDIPAINAASASGGFARSEGFVRSRAFNCGGVRGSEI